MDLPLRKEDLGFADPAEEPLDVLDLPQIYSRPSAKTLLDTLSLLSVETRSWEVTPSQTPGGGTPRTGSGASTPLRPRKRKVRAEGVPQYLTKIVSSHLAWIPSEDQKEQIWDMAAVRLSERAGRTAMGSFTRSFPIPTLGTVNGTPSNTNEESGCEPTYVDIQIHEPALTADNLGFKTWAASYVLACTWTSLLDRLPVLNECQAQGSGVMLELGAGTGLVGIAAAAAFGARVLLTDLPLITPNLERNVKDNTSVVTAVNGTTTVAVLDWSAPETVLYVDDSPQSSATSPSNSLQARVVVAADPVYTVEHPPLLVKTIEHHLSTAIDATVIIALPLRDGYADVRQDLRLRLSGIGLRLLFEETATGTDDWVEGKGEEATEVECSITVWTRA